MRNFLLLTTFLLLLTANAFGQTPPSPVNQTVTGI